MGMMDVKLAIAYSIQCGTRGSNLLISIRYCLVLHKTMRKQICEWDDRHELQSHARSLLPKAPRQIAHSLSSVLVLAVHFLVTKTRSKKIRSYSGGTLRWKNSEKASNVKSIIPKKQIEITNITAKVVGGWFIVWWMILLWIFMMGGGRTLFIVVMCIVLFINWFILENCCNGVQY